MYYNKKSTVDKEKFFIGPAPANNLMVSAPSTQNDVFLVTRAMIILEIQKQRANVIKSMCVRGIVSIMYK